MHAPCILIHLQLFSLLPCMLSVGVAADNVETPKAEETGLPEISSDDSIDGNVTDFAKLWGWNGCSNEDKNSILGGLSEAQAILRSDGCFSIGRHWNDYATVEFLGSPRVLLSERKGVQVRLLKSYTLLQSLVSLAATILSCTFAWYEI